MDGVGSRLSDSPGLMTPPTLHRLIALALGATAVAAAATPVCGSEPRAKIFRLPAEPVEEALLRFALQGDVSVGWTGRTVCQGLSRPVIGALAPADALARLLPPDCKFEQMGARTFRVVARRARPKRPSSVAPPTTAAPAPGPPPVVVEELVVTAEKRSEPLLGSPFPISALTGSELTRLGADTFQEVASQIVGVAVTNLGPGRDKIFVRGMSDGSFTGVTQSTVGLYLDDAPITYNAPDPALRLADVERIEVLRGPQGSLYGSGSIGGIIRIVTAKPDPTRFSGSVAVEGALAQRGAGSAAAQVVLNAPIGSSGAAARFVAYDETVGGYIDNPRLGLRDVNRSRRTGGRLSLVAPLGDWRLLLTAAHQEIDNIDSQYTGSARSLSRDTQVREPHDNEISIVSLTASRPTRWGDIKLTAAHVDHALHTRYDASGAFGTSGAAAFDERQRVHMVLAQAEFASNLAGRAHWLAGVFASATSEPQDATLAAPLEPLTERSVYHRDDHLAEAAAYGEFGYDLTPQFTLTLGGRLFSSWLRTQVSDFELAPTVAPLRSDLRDNGFAPKVRLSYAAAPDRVIYLQAQEGYRTGGFNLPLGVVGMSPDETYR
ncbi:MAG: TonB-dependent receptor, partial [Phenylobacterium sp.]|nr:TonB-dependent receptor [Phenylobacterium sp.]